MSIGTRQAKGGVLCRTTGAIPTGFNMEDLFIQGLKPLPVICRPYGTTLSGWEGLDKHWLCVAGQQVPSRRDSIWKIRSYRG